MRYLDHAATAPVRREVLEAMWPFLTSRFGNPASVHALGQDAAGALEAARAEVAAAIGGRASEVIFTSGGTEADNLAVKGIALARRAQVGATRVVTCGVEHSAVLESARWLSTLGFEVEVVAVDGDGLVDLDGLRLALARGSCAVVSIQLANNEVGTIQPIREVARLTREAGSVLHTDAVQAVGSIGIDVAALGVDALSISGHKIGTPKGIGALWLRRGVGLEPLLHGGDQERGRRAGTQDPAGAVGLATALRIAEAERRATTDATGDRLAALRDAFIERVLTGLGPELPRLALTGHPTRRLPGHASFVLGEVSGESVLLELEARGVLTSSASACHAGSDEPSHVLTAMGLDREVAQTALRFSVGRATSAEDLDAVADALTASVRAVLN